LFCSYTGICVYRYHNIGKIKITIDGVANSAFSQGLRNVGFIAWLSVCHARAAYGRTIHDTQVFFKDKFAWVIDLHTSEDNFAHGNDQKIINTQSDVVILEIKKVATTDNVKTHIQVVLDVAGT
jgi:hypothetical protein